MKTAARILAVVGAVIMQTTLFGHWRPLGVMPNLLLITVILLALFSEASTTLALSIAGGFLLDLASDVDFGLRTAFMTLIALAIIAARQFGLHAESLVTTLILTALGTIVFDVAVVLSANAESLQWGYVVGQTLREVILNVIIMLAILAIRELIVDRRSRVATELRRGSWL